MKKQIGIWLDYKEAIIINLYGAQPTVKTIASEIEDFHLKGGARSKTPYGPMDKTSEKKLLERRKKQADNFYKKIMEQTKNADEILIMGPAEAKIGLRKKMTNDKAFSPFVVGFETVDSITENQKVAYARDFFSSKKVK